MIVGALNFLIVRPTGSASSRARKDARPPLGEHNLGIVYGATPDQVRRRLASPDEKRAGCWIYDAPRGTVNGIATFQGVDGMKYCFLNGVVSDIQWHFETYTWKNQPVPAHWGEPENFQSTLDPPNALAG